MRRHSTEKAPDHNIENEDKVYSPIEDYQKIASGGSFNRNSLSNIKRFPKWLKIIGFVVCGTFALMIVIALVLNLF